MSSQVSNTYNSESEKWDAYQFSDPFATSSFICGNKKLNIICRANCDYYPKVDSKDEVYFFDTLESALAHGFVCCEHCDPSSYKTQLDLPLIKTTIDSINYSIGLSSDTSDFKRRAFSVPFINTRDGHYNDRQLTRNESEHIKLVELACRHIASAAATSVLKQQDESSNKKKRRGGVLGFKELASKSKLSPWHFHRVFKSVTGLTPKSYGDQCWKFIKNRERPQNPRQRSHFKSNSEISKNFQARPTLSKNPSVKDEPVAPRDPIIVSDDNKIDTNLSYSENDQPLMDLNRNSLDINVTPFKHHSLDLGSLSLDLSDFSSNIMSQLSPQLVSFDQNQYFNSLQTNQQNLGTQQFPFQESNQYKNFPYQQPVTPQLSHTQYSTSQSHPQLNNQLSSSSNPDLGSLELHSSLKIDEGQWPSLEGSTPADQEASKLLTPPSSVSESDFIKSNGPIDDPTMSLYEVFKNSPLDNDDDLLDLNNNYILNNNSESEQGIPSGNDVDHILFNGLVTMKQPVESAMLT